MSKPKYRDRSRQRKGHSLYVPRVGLVQLAPSRASTMPFCAYYGPRGQTCSNTTSLEIVGTLPGFPAYHYMACPLHFEAVSQMLQAFLADLEASGNSHAIP